MTASTALGLKTHLTTKLRLFGGSFAGPLTHVLSSVPSPGAGHIGEGRIEASWTQCSSGLPGRDKACVKEALHERVDGGCPRPSANGNGKSNKLKGDGNQQTCGGCTGATGAARVVASKSANRVPPNSWMPPSNHSCPYIIPHPRPFSALSAWLHESSLSTDTASIPPSPGGRSSWGWSTPPALGCARPSRRCPPPWPPWPCCPASMQRGGRRGAAWASGG